jgi:O-antigen ligase
MKARGASSAPIAAVFSWMVASAAVWLAAGSQPGVLTLLLFAVGVLYIFFPPNALPMPLMILFGLLLLLVGVAFLPADWNGSGFRKPFLDHGINLPSTTSLQPWLTLEDLTLLLVTVLWAWICFETKLSTGQRELLVASYLGVLGLVALDTILRGTSIGVSLPSFFQGAGQFENRNQTGDILLMGGLFAFARGFSDLSKRKLMGLIWMALTIIFIVAIIRNGSRAALLLFGIGLLVFLLLTPRKQRISPAGLAMLFVIGVTGVLIFAFEGADLRARFLVLALGHEGRLPLYQDAAAMMWTNPWSGVGLGNFEGIFNTARNHSLTVIARALHPDSDWWWLAVELGPFGVILFGAIIWTAFRAYLSKTPFPSLTQASATIAIIFLIHSLVDVGGHRIGDVWSCLYLVGLGAYRTAAPTEIKCPPWIMRAAGVFVCVVALGRVQAMSLQPWMPIRGSVLTVKENLTPSRPLSEQKNLLDRAIKWAPLDWTLYYRRGLVSLQNHDLQESDADFNRVLFLDQSSTAVPLSIGEACRPIDWPEAMIAWKELLRRAGPQRENFYENLYYNPGLDVRSRLALTTLAEDDSNLQTIALLHQEPSEFKWLRDNLLASNPTLEGISPPLAKRLFDRWAQADDVDQFISAWPLHPEWQTSGWRAYVRSLAAAGRYQDAVTTALQLMHPPPMPDFSAHPSLDQAMQQYEERPQDPYAGILLYFAQKSTGQDELALDTLKTLAKLPVAPAYVQFLLAKSLATTGQNEAAWQTLAPLLDQP